MNKDQPNKRACTPSLPGLDTVNVRRAKALQAAIADTIIPSPAWSCLGLQLLLLRNAACRKISPLECWMSRQICRITIIVNRQAAHSTLGESVSSLQVDP
jgi:hypothetical protein